MVVKTSVLAAVLVAVAQVAAADAILNARPCSPPTPCTDPGWAWEYTFTDPTADPDWSTTAIWADSNTGNAPFGSVTGGVGTDPDGFFDYVTLWPADDSDGNDLWLRTVIDLSAFDLSTISWSLGVDNGFALYVNGNFVSSDNGEDYTFRWEYGGVFPAEFLVSGLNYVALALEDHGYDTAFDMEIVPEPSSAALLALGLVALGWRRNP